MDTPQQLILVPAADLQHLIVRVESLARAIEASTITPAPKWLSIADAAQALKCDRSTIHRRIASGELEAKGSGRLRRVLVDLT